MFQKDLAALCALTQQYLLENYALTDRIPGALEHVDYFRNTLKTTTAPASNPVSVATKPPPALSPASLIPSDTPVSAPRIIPSAVTKRRSPLPVPEKKQDAPPELPPLKELALSSASSIMQAQDEEMLRLIKEVAPHIPITSLPVEATSPFVAIIRTGETAQELRFLQHIATAVSICFNLSCRVVDTSIRCTNETKIILIAECRMEKCQITKDMHIVPLPDLSLHMQNPRLKAALWITLRQAVARHAR